MNTIIDKRSKTRGNRGFAGRSGAVLYPVAGRALLMLAVLLFFLTFLAASVRAEFPDWGDDSSSAQSITLPFYASNGYCADADWLKFTLAADAWVIVNVVEKSGGEIFTKLHLHDASNLLDFCEGCHKNYFGGCSYTSNTTEIYDRTYYDDEVFIKAKLKGGVTYHIEIDQIYGNTSYDVRVVTTQEAPDFSDDYSTATSLGDLTAVPYNGYVDGEICDSMSSDEGYPYTGDNGDLDWLTFTVSGPGRLKIRVEELPDTHGEQYLRLYDDASGANFGTVYAGSYYYGSIREDTNSSDRLAYIEVDIVAAGPLYLRIENECNSRDDHRSFASLDITYETSGNFCFRDADGDHYGNPLESVNTGGDTCVDYCTNNGYPAGYWISDNTDCDDNDAAINPGAAEVCDGIDNNCDGDTDEGHAKDKTYYRDSDGDGYGDPDTYFITCLANAPAGWVTDNTDCDDGDANINPGAFDICGNGVDENCDGQDAICGVTDSICAQLSDIPLEVQVESAPPIVMFLVDDSGSMAWDLLCPEYNGKFNGNSSYSSTKTYWQSQYSGYNGVYYNPELVYDPWPDSSTVYENASMDTPRKHPDNSYYTQTLGAEFTSRDGVSIKWSHYYVWSSSENAPYLVNITGSGGSYALDYYKVTGCGNGGCALDNEDAYVNYLSLDTTPPGEVVSGRTAEEERQNFANWYQYYRTRQLTAISALGKVVVGVEGMEVGLHAINKGNSINLVAPRSVDDYLPAILDDLYDIAAYGGTPLRRGLEDVGDYFDNETTNPWAIPDQGGMCQQAFCIMMTDGYYNGYDPAVGNADADTSNEFDGGIYADAYSNTLADVAMYYYKRDLSDSLDNVVPTCAWDPATHQHMVTYTVSFGLKGLYDPDAYNLTGATTTCATGATCTKQNPCNCAPVWPAVDENCEDERSITDLWHAAVNGRGRYMEATNAQQLAHTLVTLMQEVSERRGSGASVAVNTQTLEEGTMLFQGSYNSAGWTGDLRAYAVDSGTGDVADNHTWSAAEVLDATPWTSRKIFTYDPDTLAGKSFVWDNLTDTQKLALGGTADEQKNLVDFLKGDRSHEAGHAGSLRARQSVLGDIAHSAPVHIGDTIYVGANDGMLHAFDDDDGSEKFAYIPNLVYSQGGLRFLADPAYGHRYFVDCTPYIRNGLLVGGLGKGGKGVFALDVSDPDNFAADDVLWEYPVGTDDDMGFTYPKPITVPISDSVDVVLVSNGYDSVNAKAVLYVLSTGGGLLQKIDTLTGAPNETDCNGLSDPLAVDVDFDGYLDFVYAGDLQGNLWKFDCRGSVGAWDIFHGTSMAPEPLFTAGLGVYTQSITTKPAAMTHCLSSRDGYIIIFGTGKFISVNDFDTTSQQTVYGIWDWAEEWEEANNTEGPPLGTGTVDLGDKTLTLYGRPVYPCSQTDLFGKPVDNTETGLYREAWFNAEEYVDGEPVEEIGDYIGWYANLTSGTGERMIADPTIRVGLALLVTLIPSSSPCESGGTTYLTVFDACDGSCPGEPAIDTNEDGVVDEEDELTENRIDLEEIYYKPVIIDDFLYFSEEDPLPGPHEALGMAYWRFLKVLEQ